jgi:oxaloacetate decarboxylase alpha subunit
VGTQAVFNVLFGRYNRLSGEFQDLLAGRYGACPAPKNQDVVKKALETLKMDKAITHRPADDIPAEYGKLEEETKKLLGTSAVTEEDVLTYAMFPKVAPDFFKKRPQGPVVFRPEGDAPKAQGAASAGQAAKYSVNVDGVNYNVVVAPAGTVAITPAAGGVAAPAAIGGIVIPAPVAGTVIRYTVDEGSQVKSGDTILILESMKMELDIKATHDGKVHFLVSAGTQVAAQQTIAELTGPGLGSASPEAGGSPAPASVQSPSGSATPTAAPSVGPITGTVIPAPVAGTVIRYAVNEGAQVVSGDTIIIIESMKMELDIKATVAGKVRFLVPAGTQVASQQPIAEIK